MTTREIDDIIEIRNTKEGDFLETSDELAIILNRIDQLEKTIEELKGVVVERILSKSEQLERVFTTRFDAIDAALRKQSKETELEEEALKIRTIMIEYLKKNLVKNEASLNDAIFSYQPVYKRGLIYIFLNDFKRYLANEHGLDKEKPELVNFFNLLNVKHTVLKTVDPKTKKHTSRSAFVLPSTWVVLVEKGVDHEV